MLFAVLKSRTIARTKHRSNLNSLVQFLDPLGDFYKPETVVTVRESSKFKHARSYHCQFIFQGNSNLFHKLSSDGSTNKLQSNVAKTSEYNSTHSVQTYIVHFIISKIVRKTPIHWMLIKAPLFVSDGLTLWSHY